MKKATILIILFLTTTAVVLPTIEIVHADINIYIRADGTVDPASAPIQRSGNVYALTRNVTSAIVIEKDGVVLDGAGYWINDTQAENAEAVEVVGRRDVTIKNLHIGNVFRTGNFETGILLENSSGIVVADNSLNDVFFGVLLKESSGNTVSGNNLANVFDGVKLWKNCANNVINDNVIEEVMQSGIHLELGSSGNVISGNAIAGQTKDDWSPSVGIEMVSSTNNTVLGNAISSMHMGGIRVQQSTNGTISSNTITQGGFSGISLQSSENNVLSENRVTDCSAPDGGTGISLSQTASTTLMGNSMSNNTLNFEVSGWYSEHWIQSADDTNLVEGKPLVYWTFEHDKTVPPNAGLVVLANCTGITVENTAFAGRGHGVILAYSFNCTMAGNTATNNCTVRLYASSDNRVTGNVFTGNNMGLHLENYCFNNIVRGNNFTDNNNGFSLTSSSSNTIEENNFVNNGYGLYFYTSSSNNIFRNNFLNNTYQVYDAGMTPQASVTPAASKTHSAGTLTLLTLDIEPANFAFPPPLSTNNWNSGNFGNYWSDYNGTDADGDGIGDTPHFLYGNNADNYPLVQPAATAVPEFPAWVILPLLATAMLCALMLRRKVLK